MTRSAPLSLRRGDTVDIVSASFAILPERLDAGVQRLRRMGLVPRPGAHVRAGHGYLAGDDAARLGDLQSALGAGDGRGVWFSRGGYGAARLIDRLDLRPLARRPKVLVGHSDLTALLLAAADVQRRPALHGPFVGELGDPAAYHAPSLRAMLAGREVTLRFRADQVLAPGRAEGRLVGGNLTVLAHVMGTPWAPDGRGAVLLLEDVGEETYRLDRLLQHLRLAGALTGVRAVLLGSLDPPPTRRSFPPDGDLDAVLRDVLLPLGVPVVRGLPLGHLPGKWTVPLGGRAVVDTAARRLVFEPAYLPPPRRR